MRKLFMMLVVLFFIYFMIQLGFNHFGKGHNITYSLKTNDVFFTVDERFINNTKDEINSYLFNVKFNDKNIFFQTYDFFSNSERIIQKIKYFEDENFQCILPIFAKDKNVTDIMCLENNVINYYYNLIGKSKKLDAFANELKDYKVGAHYLKDNLIEAIIEPIIIYENNMLENHFLAFTDYKGISTLNKVNFRKKHHIELFSNDVYKRDVEGFYDNYYVVPNYNQKHDYNGIYIINIVDNKETFIKSNQKISFDSYIQGIIKNKLYLVDIRNKKQYQIDINKGIILEVGNIETGAYNENLERVSINEVVNIKNYFNNDVLTSSDKEFYRIDKTNFLKTGYTYFYKNKNNLIEVYRSPNDSDLKTYLFSASHIDDLKYVKDYIYFREGSFIKYYHDSLGLRTLMKYEELNFNDNLKFNIYLK